MSRLRNETCADCGAEHHQAPDGYQIVPGPEAQPIDCLGCARLCQAYEVAAESDRIVTGLLRHVVSADPASVLAGATALAQSDPAALVTGVVVGPEALAQIFAFALTLANQLCALGAMSPTAQEWAYFDRAYLATTDDRPSQ